MIVLVGSPALKESGNPSISEPCGTEVICSDPNAVPIIAMMSSIVKALRLFSGQQCGTRALRHDVGQSGLQMLTGTPLARLLRPPPLTCSSRCRDLPYPQSICIHVSITVTHRHLYSSRPRLSRSPFGKRTCYARCLALPLPCTH
jgi:hypothetical protein